MITIGMVILLLTILINYLEGMMIIRYTTLLHLYRLIFILIFSFSYAVQAVEMKEERPVILLKIMDEARAGEVDKVEKYLKIIKEDSSLGVSYEDALESAIKGFWEANHFEKGRIFFNKRESLIDDPYRRYEYQKLLIENAYKLKKIESLKEEVKDFLKDPEKADNSQLLLLLALESFEEGRYASSLLSIVDIVVKRFPTNESFKSWQTQLLLKNGPIDKAELVIDRYINDTLSNPLENARWKITKWLLGLKKEDTSQQKGIEELVNWLITESDSLLGRFRSSSLIFQGIEELNLTPEHIKFLLNELSKYDFKPIWDIRITLSKDLGNLKEYEKIIKEALEKWPTDEELIDNLSNYYKSQGKIEEIIPYLKGAISKKIELKVPMLRRALRLYMDIGNQEGMLPYLAEILPLTDDPLEVFLAVKLGLQNTNQQELVNEGLKRIKEIAGINPHWMSEIAFILWNYDSKTNSYTWIEDALARFSSPQDVEQFWTNLGNLTCSLSKDRDEWEKYILNSLSNEKYKEIKNKVESLMECSKVK